MPDDRSERPARENRRSGKPNRERRAPAGTPGSLSWLKGLLGRPLVLERRGMQLHVRLVERRRSAEAIQAEKLERLCGDLSARLLAQEKDHAVAVMRHLVGVHDTLRRQGWAGLELMSSAALRRAGVQAEMLDSQEPSPALTNLVERLRVLAVAAELREERDRGPRPDQAPDGGGDASDATDPELPARAGQDASASGT